MNSIASGVVKRRKLNHNTPVISTTCMMTAETRICRLLELPLELQLAIYELVVIEHRPLLINVPCNSSYRERYEKMDNDEKDWDMGVMHPPLQPALAQTCRSIRIETLPIFYGENVFRACYCSKTTMLPPALRWLRMIGQASREMLRHFYFYDRNEYQDRHSEYALNSVKASEVESELGGRLETMTTKYCCAHLVAFGKWRRKESEVPLALKPGVPRLRMEGEI